MPENDDKTATTLNKAFQSEGLAPPRDVLKEAGVSKEDFVAATTGPKVSLVKSSAFGGAAGVGLASAVLPLAQLVKNKRTGWDSFSKAFSKSATGGAIAGGVIGMAMGIATNHKLEKISREASGIFDKVNSSWVQGEEAKKEQGGDAVRGK